MTRLPSSVTATALMRLAEQEGGSATVLAKGDLQSGTILVLLSERGEHRLVVERMLRPSGDYEWQESSSIRPMNVSQFIEKRRSFDPDCWIVELDVASAERFAAGMKQIA